MTVHQCTHGSALEKHTWVQAMAGRLADVLLTDPPYCLLTRRRKGGDLRDSKQRKIDKGPVQRFETVRDFRDFTQRWLETAMPFLSAQAPLVIWMNLLGKEPLLQACRDLGYSHLLGEFVWGKRTREGNSGEEILRVVETALVVSRSPPVPPLPQSPAIPWAAVAGYDDDGEATRWGSHPNHKPFGVLEPLVRTWSQPGQLVVDPFAGSGSIPAAALRLERQVACIEIEPEWSARVTERLSQLETLGLRPFPGASIA